MIMILSVLTSSISVLVELIVDPLWVLAHFGNLVCDFEERVAELQFDPIRGLLKQNVRLYCHQDPLLDLFVVLESDF